MPAQTPDEREPAISREGGNGDVSSLPYIVYGNIGDGDNLVPIKRLLTYQDAENWIAQLQGERPGYYFITTDDELRER